MRNYSFSNITNEQSFGTRKSNDFSQLYRHSDLKSADPILRVEEIKMKYDTPSRNNPLRHSKDFDLLKQEQKDTSRELRNANPNPATLKESFAVNRLQKNSLRFDADAKDIVGLRNDFRRSNEKENDYGGKSSSREQQAAILSKVRQMKESIINQNDYPRFNNRSSIPSFNKYPTYLDARYEGRREFDPRVQNIDKINSKIKQILNCLSDNQKRQQVHAREGVAAKEDANTSKDSAFFGYKAREGSEAKRSYENSARGGKDCADKPISIQQKPTLESAGQGPNKYEPYSKIYDNIKVKSREYSVNPKVDIYRPKEEIGKTPVYLSKEGSRSRSQIDSNKKAVTPSDSVLKSGKKVNDEISRIQKKIEEFEKEKRKLNIQFTPFTLKHKSTANLNASISSKPQKQSDDIRHSKNSEDSQSNVQEPTRFTANQRSSSNDLKFKSYLNRAADYSQKYGSFASKDRESSKSSIYDNPKPKVTPQEDFELKIQKIEVKNIQTNDSPTQSTISPPQEQPATLDEGAIKKRTDDGIEERRKRRKGEGNVVITTETLKSIVNLFCQQVKLDENLRNMKIWLQSCSEADKNSKLSKALQEEGMQVTPDQCTTLFTLDESQNNPFFSVQGFPGSYSALAQAYNAAQQHWRESIQHKFEGKALLSEGFNAQKIDLQRKGFIELQDLVRFLNIESGTFFRNRDLFLIFRRLTPNDRLNFETMLSEVSVE